MAALTILMPVHNEAATVEAAIDDALEAELPVAERQLVIVDDGSTDGTRELLRSRAWPEGVTVLYHAQNAGKGAAVRTALGHATGDFAAILDADLELRAAADAGDPDPGQREPRGEEATDRADAEDAGRRHLAILRRRRARLREGHCKRGAVGGAL